MFSCFLIISLITISYTIKEFNNDLFYDETFNLRRVSSERHRKQQTRPTISNLQEYLKTNIQQQFHNITIHDKGDSNIILNLDNFIPINNLNRLSNFLNEKNHIYELDSNNLFIFSYCSEFIYCRLRLVFVSRIDFAFYEFSQIGDKLPVLNGLSLDFYKKVNFC
jgi:hypothetical protein